MLITLLEYNTIQCNISDELRMSLKYLVPCSLSLLGMHVPHAPGLWSLKRATFTIVKFPSQDKYARLHTFFLEVHCPVHRILGRHGVIILAMFTNVFHSIHITRTIPHLQVVRLPPLLISQDPKGVVKRKASAGRASVRQPRRSNR